MRRVAAIAIVLGNAAACQTLLDFESGGFGRGDAATTDAAVGSTSSDALAVGEAAFVGTDGADADARRCRTLAIDAGAPANLALAGEHVYFISGDSVFRTPKKDDDTLDQLPSIGKLGPFVAASASAVFWGVNSFNNAANANQLVPCPYGVARYDLKALKVTLLNPTCDSRNSQFGELALDATKVFWINGEHRMVNWVDQTTGGSASGFQRPVAPEHIALTQTRLYWIESKWLYDSPKNADTTNYTMMSVPFSAVAAEFDDSFLYYASDAIYRRPAPLEADGGAIAPALGVTALRPFRGALYWSEVGLPGLGGSVMRYTPDGGAQPIATQQVEPHGLAVDDSGVYWVTGSSELCTAPL